MKTTQHVLTGLILFFLTMIQVQTVAADALGLPEGSYIIAIDLDGTAHDATGTMTIGAAGVTAFDVLSADLSHWQCDPCGIPSASPDTVGLNSIASFRIQDDSAPEPTFFFLQIFDNFRARELIREGSEITTISGRWGAREVPEPISLSLFGLGAVGLYIRRRRLG